MSYKVLWQLPLRRRVPEMESLDVVSRLRHCVFKSPLKHVKSTRCSHTRAACGFAKMIPRQEQKRDFIHYNPVVSGLVTEPQYWKYSSAIDNFGGKGIP